MVGATGMVGRSLVPLLLGRGHEVLALARSPQRASPLSEAGAEVERFYLLEIGEAGRLSGDAGGARYRPGGNDGSAAGG